MPSGSHQSRGSRLAKLKMLRAKVKTFFDYEAANEDLTLAQLDSFIDSIEGLDADLATKMERYSTAVDIRQKGFKTNDDSLLETAGNIVSKVRVCIGINSKEAGIIAAMCAKIKGEDTTKTKKKPGIPKEKPASADPSVNNIPNAKSISRIESTLGNMVKMFDAILSTLVSYGARYTGTKKLSIKALQDQSAACHAMTAKADESLMELQLSRGATTKGYIQLEDIFKRTKEGVRLQYGRKSAEYLAVKAIKS